MSEPIEHQESLADKVLALGELGWGRAEIAAALGSNEAELKAREEADADFAYAMQRADTAARAWLCRSVREQLMARWDWGLYFAFMAWQWPEHYGPQAQREPAAAKRPNWRRWRAGIGFA